MDNRHRLIAERSYLEAAKLFRSRQYADAERLFAVAAANDPQRPEYAEALAVAREHHVTSLIQQAAATRAKDPARADAYLAQARTIDAENPRLTQRLHAASNLPLTADTARMLPPAVQTQIASPISLAPSPGRQSFHLRGDTRTLAIAIGERFGVRMLFDTELQPKTVRLELDDVDFATAVETFRILTGIMIVALDEHSALLANDTAANRARLERIAEETFDLSGFTPEQVNDIAGVAKNVFDIRQVSIRTTATTVALRAPVDTLAAADKLFRDLIGPSAEVVLDVKLYAIDQSHGSQTGVQLPQQFSAYSLATEAQNIVNQNQSVVQQIIASGLLPANATTEELALYLVFVAGVGKSALLSNSFLIFGGGLSLGAVSVGNSPVLDLALNRSDARTLDDLQLRVGDMQTATFRSGTRYPIQTSLFTDIASPTSTSALSGLQVNGVSLSSLLSQYLGSNGGGTTNSLPQIQYEDLGLTMKAVPHVQRDGDVVTHLELKLDALAGAALNGIPVLANRLITSDMTLHDGQTTMLATYLSQSESDAVSGLPGLSEIPGFQSTTDLTRNQARSELVLLITPHIVRRGHISSAGPYIPLQSRPTSE